MIFNTHFLAVLDDDYFKDNIYKVAELLDNKADIIWYRFKKYENIDEKLFNLRKIISKSSLILSRDYHLAIKYNFDGIHLNKESINNYNFENNKDFIIGYSAHSNTEIDNIKADYYCLSPIYNTPKEYNVTPLGIVTYNKSKKVFALGGITLENIDIIKDNFYGFAGIRIIKDIVNINF